MQAMRQPSLHRGHMGSKPGVHRAPLPTCRAAGGAGGGFGKGGGSKKRVDMSGGIAIPAPKQKKEKQQQPPPGAPVGSGAPKPPAGPVGAGGSDWAAVGKVDELFTLERPAKAVILPSGIKLCVYKYGNKVFASQLESTAYQFPLFDGKLSEEKGRVIVEVPLDGTQYDLTTGAVLKWCPREGNPLRGVLGALKSNQPSVPLKVYPVRVATDGTVSVKLL